MRKLVVSEFVTLDGVMEAPGGEPTHPHTGWVGELFGDGILRYKLDEILGAESLLVGRVTYESFAGAWPERDGEMADKLNTMTKYVASTTLTSADWPPTTIIDADVPARVAELKAGDGGPILVAGSRSLVHTLLDEGLVDEINLQVFPLVLGSGARVYPDTETPVTLELVFSEALPNGVQTQTYRVLR
jgi:dihydrofolate reductase